MKVAQELNIKALMTAGQVAGYLSVSRHTVYQWICDGRLAFPYYKLPRGVRFDRRDVDKWLETRKITPAIEGVLCHS